MKNKCISKPIIYEMEDNRSGIDALSVELKDNEIQKELLMDYPIVYIHNWKKTNEYEVYIGEANDIVKRTRQHYESAINDQNWKKLYTAQIGGIDDTIRVTKAVLKDNFSVDIHESIMTTGEQKAVFEFSADLDGENNSCNIVSHAVARDNQRFRSKASISICSIFYK